MASFAYPQVSGLLEKMSSSDKDFRFMATNDLMTELQKGSIQLDDETERKISKALLGLMHDKNGEVQNLAVRCLGPLVRKIKSTQLNFIMESLCTNMESTEDRLRDASSVALKTVISELPLTLCEQTLESIKQVIPRLNEGLGVERQTEMSAKMEILDILSTLISRYGSSLDKHFSAIETVLFQQMMRERQTLRKRAISALSYLVNAVGNEQYERIIKTILDTCISNSNDMSNPKSLANLRNYVLAAAAICRSSPSRFSPFLKEFMPRFIQYCNDTDDDELRETCIQAFETFIYRCPDEIQPFISQITKIVSTLQKYDPNYNYAGIENGECMEVDDDLSPNFEAEESEEEGSDEYSDDDDLSWKVRRASTKCIEALLNYRGDKLLENYQNLGPLLIDRFKEREESVKHEVFNAYMVLLKCTRHIVPYACQRHLSSSIESSSELFSKQKFEELLREELNERNRQIFELLKSQIPSLLRAIQKSIAGKNLKTRQQCFVLLTHLLRAYPGALSSNIRPIAVIIRKTLMDKNSDGNMKIETLKFTAVMLCSHEPEELCSSINILTPSILSAINDSFYKIATEALTVTQALIRVASLQSCASSLDLKTFVSSLYATVFSKFKIADIDQEVKERTITTMSLIIGAFNKSLDAKQVDECFTIFLDRIRNEMSRLVSLKAFQTIITISPKVECSKFLPELLLQLAEFLRKNQRTLRIHTLLLLELLVTTFSQNGLQSQGLIKIVKEIPTLINENDLQISLLSFKFITDVVTSYPDQISDTLPLLFESLISVTQSSLLQGTTLKAALTLYNSIFKSPLPNKPKVAQVISQLSSICSNEPEQIFHRQTYISIGKAIATILHATNDKTKACELIKKYEELLKNPTTTDSIQLFSLIFIGELGRVYPAAYEQLPSSFNPECLIVNSFNSHSEEVKLGASYALGSLATGNLKKILPFLLAEIDKDKRKQYLLLHSLKEVIISESIVEDSVKDTFMACVPRIWQVLIEHCDSTEEGTRNIVAECLGKLCIIEPGRYLSEIVKCLNNNSPRVRSTIVTASRFMIFDQPKPIDEALKSVIGNFLAIIRDPDYQCRRVAIVTLNSAAHNKPKLIRDCLTDLLKSLYNETTVKPELVHEVEMGPFKHTVDDGLDLRKAAFECMYTLSEQCLDRLDLYEFLSKVENGLNDQYDIKLLTYLMLVRLSYKCPQQVAQRIDRLCEGLKPQIELKPKQNTVKQENEKQDELKRSAIRVVIALKKISGGQSQKLEELLKFIRSAEDLNEILNSLEKEKPSQTNANGEPMEE